MAAPENQEISGGVREDPVIVDGESVETPIDAFINEPQDDLESQVKSNKDSIATLEKLIIGFHTETSNQLAAIMSKLSVDSQTPSPTDDLTPAPMMKVDSSADAWRAAASILQDRINDRSVNDEKQLEVLKGNAEELQRQLLDAEEKLQKLHAEKNKYQHEKEILQQKLREGGQNPPNLPIEFPSNETVIHNLLISQIEFYFSDHHLKRDKPLMQKLTEDPIGFVPFTEVTKFPKVRTLGQDQEVVQRAVMESKYLDTRKSQDGRTVVLVGRRDFCPPKSQEFPFRRTVFIFGIPPDKNEGWIRSQFDCFGVIQKVKFDSGPHSGPRNVGARLLAKDQTRVTRLTLMNSDHTEFQFMKGTPNQMGEYVCHECKRLKQAKDGYYSRQTTGDMMPSYGQEQHIFCIQCSAKKAEQNLKWYNERGYNVRRLRGNRESREQMETMLGIDTSERTDVNSFLTCLVVYESQRQASKCVYVRSRLGIEGCFATHFHNYTRHKKEMAQGIGIETPKPESPAPDQENRTTHRLVEARTHGRRGARVNSPLAPPAMSRWRSAPIGPERFSRY